MRTFCILFLLIISGTCFSQSAWDLRKCIHYALQNNIQIKQASIQSETSGRQLRQARYNRLPSLNANIGDGFNFGRTLGSDNTYINQNSNSASGSLSTSIPVFEGFRINNDIAARKLDFMASIEDQQKIKNDVSLTVASYFLNVLLQKEFLKIVQNQMTLTDTLLKRIEVLVSSGRESTAKLYELKAQLANDVFNVTTAEKNLSLALLDLVQLLEIDDFLAFDVAIPKLLIDVSQMPIPVVVFENAVVTLPDVRAEEFRLERSKKDLAIARSAYFPSVSLSGSTSTGYFYMSGHDAVNDPFSTQIERNWRSYVGMSMSIPIFNRMSVRTNVSINKLQIQNQEFEVERAKKAIYKDIQRSMLNAKVSKDRYIAAANSAEASQKAFHFVTERFEAGRATFFDLQQSKNNLERALSEQIQAKYEFIFNTKILDFYNGKEITL
ncbi:MAG: TolC family protein [Bacteroidales bacterium]|jgi:outer membrane protein|nr:TolC family protein [Bacteroidales bacterium]